jgi:hypothetical protein
MLKSLKNWSTSYYIWSLLLLRKCYTTHWAPFYLEPWIPQFDSPICAALTKRSLPQVQTSVKHIYAMWTSWSSRINVAWVAVANRHAVCILFQFLIGESQYRDLAFWESHAIFCWNLSFFSKPNFGLLLGLGTEWMFNQVTMLLTQIEPDVV